jgi:polysaccharide pyruvyl transferase WcaK-like protein
MSAITISSRPPKRIGIVGYYGGNNLGDEAVVAILIKTIREHFPSAELFGFSMNPAGTERRHGIKAFPIRLQCEAAGASGRLPPSIVDQKPHLLSKLKQLLKKCPLVFMPLKALKKWLCDLPIAILWELAFLRRSFHRLKGFDLLVVPGSGSLTDWWGGPWSHPYSFLSWSLLAQMTGTKVIALSVGCERLKTRLGKSFCKCALSMASYRSFRDRNSRDTLEALGLKGHNPVFPDQGFGVVDLIGDNPTDGAISGRDQANARLIVGIGPIGKGCCVQADTDDPSYEERYGQKLVAFSLWLIRNGYRIAFCHTDESWDLPVVQQILEAIKAECIGEDVTSRIIQNPIRTVEELVARIRLCDIVVASRFHGVLLPLALQKPVLAVSLYSRKISDVMAELGQAAYHLPVDKAEVGEMIRMFRSLEQNRHAIARHLGARVADYRSKLARQYEDVFGSLDQGSNLGAGIPKMGVVERGQLPVKVMERVQDLDCTTSCDESGVSHAR